MTYKALAPYCRMIIRDLVYNHISIRELAKRYGVSSSTVCNSIKKWRVDPPYHLTWPRGVGWQWAKNRLPVPNFIKDIKRSEFSRLYRNHTQSELADMFGVTRKTIMRALMYHCIKRRSPMEAYQFPVDRKMEIRLREEQVLFYKRLAQKRREICKKCGRFTTDPSMCEQCEYVHSDLYNHLKHESEEPVLARSSSPPYLFSIKYNPIFKPSDPLSRGNK